QAVKTISTRNKHPIVGNESLILGVGVTILNSDIGGILSIPPHDFTIISRKGDVKTPRTAGFFSGRFDRDTVTVETVYKLDNATLKYYHLYMLK
ncbi:MAG TPA: hypothetical protein VHQ01_03045, partial [Pyrinomonadaceae bacterium]|nr:hypothetical protein [Pyrinomonadaceae bacterium]